MSPAPGVPLPRADLRADCSSCIGLCCVGPAFSASADFAIDKPAGRPCPYLRGDDLCGIHERLPERGFPGCVAFDCFGAGQRLTAGPFAGRHWRRDPCGDDFGDAFGGSGDVFAALDTLRALHEILWYLHDAREHPRAEPLAGEVDAARAEVEGLCARDLPGLVAADVDDPRRRVGALFGRVADLVRAPSGPDLARADLAGHDLRRTDLVGAGLRGALLLGADLRGADLTRADLLGADLRGADLRGADLGSSVFLTRPQLHAARGDSTTLVPSWCDRPPHWRREPRMPAR